MNSQVNVSNLLSANIDTIRNNAQLAGIYLAIMIPVGTVMAALQGGGRRFGLSAGFIIDEGVMAQGAFAVIAMLVGGIAGFVAQYWLIAGMTRGTVSPGFGRFWPYLGISILYGLALVLGFVLLIVPGIILMVRWVPLLPAVIDRESGAMNAFSDSFDLTRGHSWSVFGAGLIVVIGLMVASAVVGGVAVGIGTVLGGVGTVFAAAVGSIAEQLANVVGLAFCVGAYHLLRGEDVTVAEVFE